ncbi:hypothetical protein [Caldalkalibacillus thermarum]|uniref:hypothetical protein n=1 Tax=Caldalkalibacillus thermarum TaxID=296745 RepID=UPI0016684679|nr:hypothetical protein [Caldalkalibacillus thermarum]
MMRTKRTVSWGLALMVLILTVAAQAAGMATQTAAEESVSAIWPADEGVWPAVWAHPWFPLLRTVDLLGLGLAGGWWFAQLFFRSGGSHFTWSASVQRLIHLTVFGLSTLLLVIAAAGQTVVLSTVISPGSANGWRELFLAPFSMAPAWAWLIWLKPLFMLGVFLFSFSRHPVGMLRAVCLSGVLVSVVFSGRDGYSALFVSQLIHILAPILWLGSALGFVVYSYTLKNNNAAYHFMFKKVHIFFNFSLVIIFMMMVSGALLSIPSVGAWDEVLRTDFGFKLLLKLLLFLVLAGLMVWLWWGWLAAPSAQSVHQPQRFYTGLRRLFAIQAAVLCTGLILTGLMSAVEPPEQLAPHHVQGEVQFHFTWSKSGPGEQHTLVAYVLQNRQRVTGADVYFDLWHEADDRHVRQLYDYICLDLELGLDAWRDELVRQGYLTSVKAEERESHVYIGSALLERGTWVVRVHVQKEEEELDAYQDYQIEVR